MNKTKLFLISLLILSFFTLSINAGFEPYDTPEVITSTSSNENTEEVITSTNSNNDIRQTEVVTKEYKKGEKEFTSEKKKNINKIKNKDTLKKYGFDLDEVTSVEEIIDLKTKKGYNKLKISNEKCLYLDENNKVFRLKNMKIKDKDKNITKNSKKNDFKNVIKDIIKLYDLNDEYYIERSEKYDNNYWEIILTRKLKNGASNKYQSINIAINREDLSIAYLRFFNEEPNTTTPKIKELEAQSIAKNFIILNNKANNKTVVDKVSICYIKPNNFFNSEDNLIDENQKPKLAYEISFNEESFFVYVDAVTSNIIAGDVMLGESGGAYADAHVTYNAQNINAYWGLAYLGYYPIYSNHTYSPSSLRNSVYNHVRNKPDAYSLYVSCHGSKSTPKLSMKTSDGQWHTILSSYEVLGNWHFVFLDACYTGKAIWAEAFNITNTRYHRAFLGWYESVSTTDSYEFAELFFVSVGIRSIYDLCLEAVWEIPGNQPIRFYGDKGYNGRAWK